MTLRQNIPVALFSSAVLMVMVPLVIGLLMVIVELVGAGAVVAPPVDNGDSILPSVIW